MDDWFIVAVLWRKGHFRLVSLGEEAVEDHIVVILGNEATQTVVFLQKTYQLLGRTIVCQILSNFTFTP